MICQYKVSVYNALVDFALVMKSLLSQFDKAVDPEDVIG
jgi:hypothetical protein